MCSPGHLHPALVFAVTPVLERPLIEWVYAVDMVSEADLSGASDMIHSGKAGYMQSRPAPASFDRSMYLPSSEMSAQAPAKPLSAIQRILGWI